MIFTVASVTGVPSSLTTSKYNSGLAISFCHVYPSISQVVLDSYYEKLEEKEKAKEENENQKKTKKSVKSKVKDDLQEQEEEEAI